MTRSFRNGLIVGFLYAGILSFTGWEVTQPDAITHYLGIVATTCLTLGFIGRVIVADELGRTRWAEFVRFRLHGLALIADGLGYLIGLRFRLGLRSAKALSRWRYANDRW